MTKKDSPIFLERERYRTRRIMDGARFAPVFATFLFALPVMWGAAQDVPTASALIYVFGAWGLMIVATALISRKLRNIPRDAWRERP